MRPPTRSPSRSTRPAATQGVGSSSRAAAPRWWPRARRRPPPRGATRAASATRAPTPPGSPVTATSRHSCSTRATAARAGSNTHSVARTRRSAGAGTPTHPRSFTATNGALPADLETAHGFHDAIYTTRDAGRQWSIHRPPARTTGSIDILSADIWLVANAHTLYITSDSGTRWRAIHSSIALTGSGTRALDFVSPHDGWGRRRERNPLAHR